MNDSLQIIRERLLSLKDEKYKEFQSALIPTVDKNTIIGVRTPQLRSLAKDLYGTHAAEEFLNALPHYYYEENNLHAFLIEKENSFDKAVMLLDAFMPFVDNWATCDGMRVKVFEKHLAETEKDAYRRLNSNLVYEQRFAIVTFMKFFTGEHFLPEQAEKIAQVKTDEYYVNSAIGWYFATLLTKKYEDALPYIVDKKLNKNAHNLSIKKACESLAIPKNKKDYLKGLKI